MANKRRYKLLAKPFIGELLIVALTQGNTFLSVSIMDRKSFDNKTLTAKLIKAITGQNVDRKKGGKHGL